MLAVRLTALCTIVGTCVATICYYTTWYGHFIPAVHARRICNARFRRASATFSNGRWKRTTALKIPRKSWTERELERRTRYRYLAVVYPRLVSRSNPTLLRSSAREANSRSSDCRFRNGMWEAVFYLVQNPTRGLSWGWFVKIFNISSRLGQEYVFAFSLDASSSISIEIRKSRL